MNKPQLSPLLWENEASCRLHSPLGKTRNHSPQCKPPILQDVGNLEQETTVTHILTSLSLTPCSLSWEMERLQNVETVLPAQVCAKPHTPDDHRSGEGMLHFKTFKRYPLFPRKLCSPHIMYIMQIQVDCKMQQYECWDSSKGKSLTGTAMISFQCQLGEVSLQ